MADVNIIFLPFRLIRNGIQEVYFAFQVTGIRKLLT
jgi:hypothetical protein